MVIIVFETLRNDRLSLHCISHVFCHINTNLSTEKVNSITKLDSILTSTSTANKLRTTPLYVNIILNEDLTGHALFERGFTESRNFELIKCQAILFAAIILNV